MRGDREIGPRRPGLVRPGQRALRRFDFVDFVAACGSGVIPSHSVPESRITIDTDGAAEVNCDCGALPLRIPPALSALCECRRLFVHIGRGAIRGCRLEEVVDDGDE